MSVNNVENHLSKWVPLLHTRESTLEKDLMSVETVRKHLSKRVPLSTPENPHWRKAL
jgi:hypothetical protein